jgi:hypothetical protein
MYDGIPFTQVTFSTNGWIGMGNQAAITVTQASYLFSVNAPNNTIAPWTGNLGGNWPMPAGNGSMVHGLVGTDAYAFEWRNVNSNSAPAALTTADNVNFTVVLYGPASATPGRIEFLYGPTTGSVLTGANKAIGIENSVGGTGNYLNAIDGFSNTTSSANAWPGNGTGYRFDPPVACNGMPSAGAPLTALTTLCNGAAVPVINVTGITAATGLTYQWEESTNGGTSWANATGGTGATLSYYTPPVFAGTAIQYRLKVTCTNSGQVAYSASTTINPQSAPTTQATGLVVYNGGNGASFKWTAGNGTRRFMVLSNSPIVDPVNGTGVAAYTATTTWQNAGQQVIFENPIATSNNATVTGLTCGTTYYVKIYEYNRCGTGTFSTYINTTSSTNALSFVATPAMATLPQSVDFEGYDGVNPGIVEPGWYESTATAGAIEPSTSPAGAVGSWVQSTALVVPTIKHQLFNNTQNGWMISPKMALTAASRIKFKAAITDYGSGIADTNGMAGTDDKVNVMVSTDGCGAVWTPVYTFDATNTATLTNVLTDYTVNLTAYTGQTVQIAFQATSGPIHNGTAANYDFHIGALVIEELPACAAPIVNDVTSVTKNSATISWPLPGAGTPTAYEYAVGTATTAPAAGTETTATSVNITALAPSTTYYVFVRTKCTDVYSDWSIVKTFTTLCNYPDLLSSAGDTACGLGEATLTATADTGGIINWYAAATGGAPLASGTSYTVSGLTATTNYYVSSAVPVTGQNKVIGAATAFSPAAGVSPYFNNAGGVKTQYIIRASELQAAGIYAGPINSVAFSVGNPGSNLYNGFAVSVGQTTQNEATTTHITGLTTVYSSASVSLVAGFNTYAFTAPFTWDGTSNLVVQVCFSNNNSGNADATTWSNVNSYATGFNSSTSTRANSVTPDDICSAAGEGGIGTTSIATSRPVMTINGTGLCSGPRVQVTVTVTDAPEVTPLVSDGTICAGETTNLSVTSTNAGYTYTWMPGNLTGATQTVSPTATTTYTVTATDAVSGCVKTAQVVVTVNALPAAIAVTPAQPVFCQNTLGQLTASGSGPYIWSPQAGLFTDAAGTIAYTGTSAATVYYYADEDATFTVTTTNANGCSVSTPVNVSVTVIAAPQAAATQTFCNAGTVGGLATTAGTGILWYANQTGGTPLDAATVLVNGENYFASQTVGGCESVARAAVTVTITVIAAPEAAATQTFCNTGTVGGLTTTSGTGILWYADQTGGTPLDAATVLVNGENYFASQTVNGCESIARTGVTATITVIAAPEADAAQTFCNAGTVGGLTTTSGIGILWYADQTGGTPLDAATALVNGENYFASQTIDGCESAARAEVTVTVTITAAPQAAAVQTICNAGTVADLTTTSGTGILWYADQTGGTPLDTATALVNGADYFASQSIDGCESIARAAVTVTINVIAAPEAAATQTICNAGTVADLTTTSGTGIFWYADQTGGTPLAATTALTDGTTYFASQTVGGCESAGRTETTVAITTTAVPEGAATQQVNADVAADATLEDIVLEGVTGTVTWYATLADAQAGQNALDSTTMLIDGEDYFATQTIDGCTSAGAFAVTVDVILGAKGFDVKSFTYSPNPVKNILALSASAAINSVEVYNMLGQIVLSQKFDASKVSLDMSNLAEGTYMLKVTSGNASKTVKVIKVQ